MRKHIIANTKSRRRGATLLEFALIVPIFVALVLGMMQFGIYLNAAAGVVAMAREGARYAAVKTDANAPVIKSYLSTSGVMPAQLRADRISSVNGVTVEYYNSSGTKLGETVASRQVGGIVKVIIRYDMRDKLILGSGVTGAILNPTYTTSASFRVEQ